MRASAYIGAVICCAVLMVTAHPSAKAQNPLNKIISIQLSNEPLKRALDKITLASGVKFTYNEDIVKSNFLLNINAKNKALNEVLNEALAGLPVTYSTLDQEVFIRFYDKKQNHINVQQETRSVKTYTVSGTIKSRTSGETIIGATVRVAGTAQGTTSNEYGFYSITLPQGNYSLAISAMGEKNIFLSLELNKNLNINIVLEDATKELEAVNIIAARPGAWDIKSPQMGMEHINIQETKDIPVLLGERDVVKTIQLLPGIKASEIGGFFVRGGAADQNLILLDEAPVYNASHLFGFFSTFNSDAIKNVTVYKGGMPAQYGGRLSSVMDIKMNDGNNKTYGVNGGIGLIAAHVNIEGPIQKDKSSFLISARRTYADLFLKFSRDSTINKDRLYFYDLNAKANYILTDKDRLYLSGYFGQDVFDFDKSAGIDWGNATGTLRWNHVFNNQLFSNTSVIVSNYDYKIKIQQDINDYTILSQIKDWDIKEDLQWFPNNNNTISFGFDIVNHTIKPGQISSAGSSGITSQQLQSRHSLDNALYATNTWKASDRIILTYGLRLSLFSILGRGDYYDVNGAGNVTDTLHYTNGQIVKTYINPEPRVAAAYTLDETSSFKASYARNVQNLHLISNSTSTSPRDKWIASTNIIKPEIADEASLGYYKNLNPEHWELSLETYYKKLYNQIDYRNGANVFTNQPIETQLLFGKGRAYGLEFFLKKKVGRLTGWVSYTLSKTELKIDGINNDNWYNASQDRTHDIALVGIYKLSDKWTLSATWVFSTGNAVTFPNGKYLINGTNYYYYTERNGYRMPDYHRLDLGATRLLKQTKKYSSELNFSLYNAYGRQNAYQIDFRDNMTDPARTEAVKTVLFTFVPSISYNFKF